MCGVVVELSHVKPDQNQCNPSQNDTKTTDHHTTQWARHMTQYTDHMISGRSLTTLASQVEGAVGWMDDSIHSEFTDVSLNHRQLRGGAGESREGHGKGNIVITKETNRKNTTCFNKFDNQLWNILKPSRTITCFNKESYLSLFFMADTPSYHTKVSTDQKQYGFCLTRSAS